VSAAPSTYSDGKVLAGVDIGTLTCRLLIGRVSDAGQVAELHSDRRILRLGEGVDRTRMLRPEAMTRVIRTLQEWKPVIEIYRVERTIAVATSAVRDAVNRDEFLDRVKREIGWEVELISGEEEARRTLLGIRSGLPADVSTMLALDIGGGSTEFILDRPGSAPVVRSIDLGVVRLTERCLRRDPPAADEVQAARVWIRKETETVQAQLGDVEGVTFVGTAGTITTLAAMAQSLPAYEPARIHNHRLSLATIRDLEQELLRRTKLQRQGLPGLERGREDVIVAGTIILRAVMETLGQSECLVSDLGLREGVLIDLARRLENRES
jgi:exopolyphosphatase/guanosine-5'-triphosphate,3'-diphosphate pyrophosphatase